MSATATATSQKIFQNNNNNELNRQEIQAAISKAVELRTLHAALMQGNSPSNLTHPINSASPPSQFSAQDYPIFTPSYEVEPVPGYHHIRFGSNNNKSNASLSDNWDGFGLLGGDEDEDDEAQLSDCRNENLSSLGKSGMLPSFYSRERCVCPAEDNKSVSSSCANHNITVLQTSPRTEMLFKSSRRRASADFESVTTCNTCRPAVISTENDYGSKNMKNLGHTAPLSDSHSHSSVQSHPKTKGPILSWLFPRLKKKPKNEPSPLRMEPEEMPKNMGIMSVEALKKQLVEANENRDAALMEVSEMKSSLGELKDKLDHLETYCEELKNALKQTLQGKDSQVLQGLGSLSRRGKSIEEKRESLIPPRHEVMVEGFLQIVSEARLSVKQFCKTLVGQIEETDSNLMEKLNLLLQPYRLSLNSKHSKVVLYHLEALINLALYQDFENCIFQKNGTPKILDPQQERQAQFSSFASLRNLSWNEVLRKGTKYYSEEFSRFCDQKMSCIIATLNWTRPWPEQLLQAFFVAAKCIWLLHLLAFSFSPPLGILRVEESRNFDPHYMEDIFVERQRSQAPSWVKIMVMPGFYVHDRVLKCKVLCRYKTVP